MHRRLRSAPPLDRHGRLHDVIARLQQRYGPRSIRLGADFLAAQGHRAHAEPDPLSTGSLTLDLLVGGLPRGAISELAGALGAGSETLALAALAACQRAGGLVLLIDAAGTTDGDALTQVGVRLDDLALACPGCAAEAWEILLALCRADALDLILAPLPDLLALRGVGAARYRPERVLPRLALTLRGRQTALLLTNRPAFLWTDTSAEPDAWPTRGGAAIARAAALRLALRPAGVRVTPYGDVAALRACAQVVHRRGHPPGSLGDPVPLEVAASGPCRAAELLALGLRLGCLEQTAVGLVLDRQVLGHTETRAQAALEAEPALAAALDTRIRAAWAARSPSAGTLSLSSDTRSPSADSGAAQVPSSTDGAAR